MASRLRQSQQYPTTNTAGFDSAPDQQPVLDQAEIELRRDVEEQLGGDKLALFALADQVTDVYRRHRHGIVCTDAVSGMGVGRFLHRVLTAEAERLREVPPQLVDLANSSDPVGPRDALTLRLFRGFHTAALSEYIRSHRGNATRAMIVTDTVSTGKSLRRLGAAVRDAGMIPDYAILATRHQGRDLARIIDADDHSEVSAVYKSNLSKPEIMKRIGYYTKFATAEPQMISDEPGHAGLGLGVVNQFYAEMADEYIATRMSDVGLVPLPSRGS